MSTYDAGQKGAEILIFHDLEKSGDIKTER